MPDIIAEAEEGPEPVRAGLQHGAERHDAGLPLGDFAKAYDGPATDPKELEEKNKKLQDELQRRANEQRQKLESGKPQ